MQQYTEDIASEYRRFVIKMCLPNRNNFTLTQMFERNKPKV